MVIREAVRLVSENFPLPVICDPLGVYEPEWNTLYRGCPALNPENPTVRDPRNAHGGNCIPYRLKEGTP